MKTVMEWLTEENQPAVRYLTMRDLLDSDEGDLPRGPAGDTNPGLGQGHLPDPPPRRLLGRRQGPIQTEIRLDELDAPHPLGPGGHEGAPLGSGVCGDVEGQVRQARWRLQPGQRQEERTLPRGEHHEGADQVRVCRRSEGEAGDRLAGEEPEAERRLALLGEERRHRRMGGDERFRGAHPRQKWTRSTKAAVDRGCDFYLEHGLLHQGANYEPWYRLHFPYHYYYDLLVGLEFITALGRGDDPRAAPALALLREKRRSDGRWLMDAVHPDVLNAGKLPDWWPKHKHRFRPFSLEAAGEPSKMITLRALRVLERVGEPLPA